MEEVLENGTDFQYILEKDPLDSVHQDDHFLWESVIQLAKGLPLEHSGHNLISLSKRKLGMTMSGASPKIDTEIVCLMILHGLF